MSCHEIREMMSAYIDGELRDQDIELIKKHSQECQQCAIIAESYFGVSRMVAMLPKVEPPSSLLDDILARTTRQADIGMSGSPRWLFNWVKKPAFAASVLLLALAALFGIKPNDVVKNESPRPEAAMVTKVNSPTDVKPSGKVEISKADRAPVVQVKEKAVPTSRVSKIKIKRAQKANYAQRRQTDKAESGISNTKYIAGTKVGSTEKPSIAPSESLEPEQVVASADQLNAGKQISFNETDKEPTSDEKPAYITVKTANSLAAERDIKLSNEADALQNMRNELKSRNIDRSRNINGDYVDLSNGKKISIEIASVKF